jgi:hypothetical protein
MALMAYFVSWCQFHINGHFIMSKLFQPSFKFEPSPNPWNVQACPTYHPKAGLGVSGQVGYTPSGGNVTYFAGGSTSQKGQSRGEVGVRIKF